MSNPLAIRRNQLWLFVAVLVLTVSFVFGIVDFLPVPSIEIRWPDNSNVATDRYIPSYTTRQGQEIVMVYLGSSTCSLASHPELPFLVERAKLMLQQQAEARGFLFSVIGVSADWVVKDGVQHLAKFGLFDEIMTGKNWQGTGVQQYGWKVGAAATPKVLVIARTIGDPSQEQPGYAYQVSEETVVIHKAGVTQIFAWVEEGAPLPSHFASSD